MKTQPFISIVTVCYNSEKTIQRTIESILQQDYYDYEYLIVDGSSKDNTLGIIKHYEPRFDGRMRWLSEPDKGIYDAFTKGCKMATGRYVWLVNSDDYIEPGALKTIKDVSDSIGKNNTILVGRMKLVSEDGSMIKTSPLATNDYLKNSFRKDCMGMTHPASIIPKSEYERIGYYDPQFKISGDIDWFNRAYMSGAQFYGFDAIITNMVIGGASNGALSFKTAAEDRKLQFKKKYSNLFVAKIHYLKWLLKCYIKKIPHVV